MRRTPRRYLDSVDPIISRRAARRLYRKRRPIPAIVILVLLVAAGTTVWVHVLRQAGDSTTQAYCPAAADTPATLPALTPLPYTALDHVRPVPAAEVRVRTLNATPQVGLAGRISLELAHYGFATVGAPGNDPRYPRDAMRCFAQIRFGSNGAAEARTLSLLVPCAQLVRDDRQDASVDLALGTYFNDLAPSGDALRVLSRLASSARSHPSGAGGLQSQQAPPAVSGALLAGAHTFTC